MAILRFDGEYRWLSNFVDAPIEYDGIVYRSVEHAYQAAKTTDRKHRKKIADCVRAGDAKREGRRGAPRKGWERMKVQVMRDLLRQKFSQPRYRRLLLATGDVRIVEGNYWGDTFWGVDDRRGGKNVLGQLLMEIRDELRQNNLTSPSHV